MSVDFLQQHSYDSFDFSDLNNSMPAVGTKLEGLLMDELEEDFNPRACENFSNVSQNFIINNNNGNLLPPSSPPPLCKSSFKNKVLFQI